MNKDFYFKSLNDYKEMKPVEFLEDVEYEKIENNLTKIKGYMQFDCEKQSINNLGETGLNILII